MVLSAARRTVGPDRSLALVVENNIPMGRGLGSSAAAAAAAAAASAGALAIPMEVDALLPLVASLDGHPDNAAAAIHGGLVAVGPGGTVARLELASVAPTSARRTRPRVAHLAGQGCPSRQRREGGGGPQRGPDRDARRGPPSGRSDPPRGGFRGRVARASPTPSPPRGGGPHRGGEARLGRSTPAGRAPARRCWRWWSRARPSRFQRRWPASSVGQVECSPRRWRPAGSK